MLAKFHLLRSLSIYILLKLLYLVVFTIHRLIENTYQINYEFIPVSKNTYDKESKGLCVAL